jgi:hypothetical protein
MGEFADELRAGIEQAARNITRALAAGDDYGAEAYRERHYALKRVAQRHGIQPPACPQPADRSDAGQDRREVAAEPADGGAAQ